MLIKKTWCGNARVIDSPHVQKNPAREPVTAHGVPSGQKLPLKGGSKMQVRCRGNLEAECSCLLTHPCKGKLGLGRGGLGAGRICLREVAKCCT